jgi:mannose-1-phosphate guanylyltransferase
MIPVGEEQKPVLDYIVRLFAHNGIKDIVLLVGYKHQQIRNYFNDGDRFGVKLHYVLDNPEFKGSANAIVNAYRQGVIKKDDILVVYYGDIVSGFDLKEMAAQHTKSGAVATIALSDGFRVRVGTADINGDLITQFHEKPELEKPVSVGILVLGDSALEEMDRMHDERGECIFDLMGDVIPSLIKKGMPIKAYLSDAFWYDLGSLERYERFEAEGLGKLLDFLN